MSTRDPDMDVSEHGLHTSQLVEAQVDQRLIGSSNAFAIGVFRQRSLITFCGPGKCILRSFFCGGKAS
jgi:hypothetical protein